MSCEGVGPKDSSSERLVAGKGNASCVYVNMHIQKRLFACHMYGRGGGLRRGNELSENSAALRRVSQISRQTGRTFMIGVTQINNILGEKTPERPILFS